LSVAELGKHFICHQESTDGTGINKREIIYIKTGPSIQELLKFNQKSVFTNFIFLKFKNVKTTKENKLMHSTKLYFVIRDQSTQHDRVANMNCEKIYPETLKVQWAPIKPYVHRQLKHFQVDKVR